MKKIHSLYYHNPPIRGFEKMLVYYLKRGYRFICLNELFSILSEKKKIKDKLAFISLDDGWNGNLDLVPIIEKYKVPICIFIATEPIESGNFWWEFVKSELGLKKMLEFKNLSHDEFYDKVSKIKSRVSLKRSALTKDELVMLSRNPLVTIQSHSVHHPILTKSPIEILQIELKQSQETLRHWLNQDIFAFSYPNGSLSQREIDVCKHFYKLAFSTEQNHINLNNDLHLLPRFALTGDFGRDLLKIWGIWQILKRMTNFIKRNK